MSLSLTLGALTPQQAADQVFPQSKVRSTPGFNQGVRDSVLAAATSGRMATPDSSTCSSVSSTNGTVKLVQTASGLALTGASIGLTATGTIAAAALAPWTLGISALIGIFPMIFQHHAQAVALENRTICAAVPAANNALDVIMNAVATGAATPQQAISALHSVENDFGSQVQSILKDSSSKCNAACVWKLELRAAVLALTNALQDLATSHPATSATASVPAPATAPASQSGLATISSSTTVSGIPTWALLAAAGVALMLVVR